VLSHISQNPHTSKLHEMVFICCLCAWPDN